MSSLPTPSCSPDLRTLKRELLHAITDNDLSQFPRLSKLAAAQFKSDLTPAFSADLLQGVHDVFVRKMTAGELLLPSPVLDWLVEVKAIPTLQKLARHALIDTSPKTSVPISVANLRCFSSLLLRIAKAAEGTDDFESLHACAAVFKSALIRKYARVALKDHPRVAQVWVEAVSGPEHLLLRTESIRGLAMYLTDTDMPNLFEVKHSGMPHLFFTIAPKLLPLIIEDSAPMLSKVTPDTLRPLPISVDNKHCINYEVAEIHAALLIVQTIGICTIDPAFLIAARPVEEWRDEAILTLFSFIPNDTWACHHTLQLWKANMKSPITPFFMSRFGHLILKVVEAGERRDSTKGGTSSFLEVLTTAQLDAQWVPTLVSALDRGATDAAPRVLSALLKSPHEHLRHAAARSCARNGDLALLGAVLDDSNFSFSAKLRIATSYAEMILQSSRDGAMIPQSITDKNVGAFVAPLERCSRVLESLPRLKVIRALRVGCSDTLNVPQMLAPVSLFHKRLMSQKVRDSGIRKVSAVLIQPVDELTGLGDRVRSLRPA
jgi:hypothetical protein